MNILDFLKNNILYLDGGMGTLLQSEGLEAGELPERWNLSHPEIITDIHRRYYKAGSNVVNTTPSVQTRSSSRRVSLKI